MKCFYTAILLITLTIIGCSEQQESSSDEESRAKDTVADSVLIEQADSFNRTSSSIGQLIYVPVYSHIYQRDREKTFNLTTTLSIRNADPYRTFTISRVDYYDSRGNLVQQYIDSEVKIDPLASTSYVIEERDLRGGVGANFLVSWESEEPIIPPVIEAVNISTSNQQGVSFLSVGRVLQEKSSIE
ncbi:DUF3124 domain-containing protein [Aliifodinibius salicampi]|uniref:DUF3124 domain-containing protein n=1 Tax=Fodinibius salicampi TaxID=1920655 RepID=A0ABT3Q0M6_9BACT|nr:DUF3124 domain-containing protein [Fodinibius salicampi]MCW9713677.1 DUF3124 domain-containing protein [Fodinibius salicampi]